MRAVYDLLKAGATRADLIAAFPMLKKRSIESMEWRIKNPARQRELARARYSGKGVGRRSRKPKPEPQWVIDIVEHFLARLDEPGILDEIDRFAIAAIRVREIKAALYGIPKKWVVYADEARVQS